MLGFPGGSVVKKQPANAEDMSSIPGPGRSHLSWSNEAHAPQLLSLCSRSQELQLLQQSLSALEPVSAPQQEKSPHWEALELQLERSPRSNQDPNKMKWNVNNQVILLGSLSHWQSLCCNYYYLWIARGIFKCMHSEISPSTPLPYLYITAALPNRFAQSIPPCHCL